MKKDDLEQIYKAYYHEIYLYALSLCKNTLEAEEITSDTFYKALLCAEIQSDSIKYWLLRVCKNIFIDQARLKKEDRLHHSKISAVHLMTTCWSK